MAEEIFLLDNTDELILKKAVANILYDQKIDQNKIANILGLSQPMVSNYIKANTKFTKEVLSKAKILTDKIIKNNNLCFFRTCILFNDNLRDNNYYLADENEIIFDENKKIIDNLYNAYQTLKKYNISKLVPEVKINLAMAKSDAKKPDDIASFVNGFVIVDNKIVSHNGIRFGYSKHLSKLLLYLKKNYDINSIMNIKYLNNLDKKSFNIAELNNDFKLKGNKKDFEVLVHKGDFGIEPCTYVVGKDAVDITDIILKILKEV